MHKIGDQLDWFAEMEAEGGKTPTNDIEKQHLQTRQKIAKNITSLSMKLLN